MSPSVELTAMDLTVAMAAIEIAGLLRIGTTEALAQLLSSRTGARLYERDLKYWCDGPSSAAEAFMRERQASGSPLHTDRRCTV